MGLWGIEYEHANWVELPLKKPNHIQSESDIFSRRQRETEYLIPSFQIRNLKNVSGF